MFPDPSQMGINNLVTRLLIEIEVEIIPFIPLKSLRGCKSGQIDYPYGT